MLQWFHRLMPRQGNFFSLFERHADVMASAARALRQMLAGNDQLRLRFEDVVGLEHEADGITREVLILLRTTFITPFDRADIKSLSHGYGRFDRPDAANGQGDRAVRGDIVRARDALHG